MTATPIRLLLLEDNPGDARLVQATLADEAPGEFVITTVERLADALQRIRKERFDAVLSDLGLPDSAGIGTAQAIVDHAPALPLVVLTGTHDMELGRAAIQLGAQDYLVKGETRAPTIARTLRYAIERKRLERELRMANETLDRRVAERTAGLDLLARRATVMLQLPDLSDHMSEREFMQQGLEFAEQLTGSRISFMHFVNEDQKSIELAAWSRDTMAHYCTAAFDAHYPISQAGIWADAFRKRAPILFNDYAACSDKRGLPQGHSPLHRLVSVPVIEQGKVRAMAGVGNKETDYNPTDVETLRLLAEEIWHILHRQRTARTLRESEERFRGLVEQSIAGIYIIQDGKFAYVNPRFAEIRGFGSADELIGLDPSPLIAEKDRGTVAENNRRLLAGEIPSRSFSFTALCKDGSTAEVGVSSTLAAYRGRAAIIGMMQDISEKRRAEEEIQRYIEQLKTAVASTVEVATALGELRDPYTAGHERRVAGIATSIGAELGFDDRRLEGLRVAGHLHDVGKITVPSEILSKPGKLNAIEMQLVRGHAQTSYDVLKIVAFPWPVAEVALQHHERMDGSGYPQGLKGEAILLEARIMAVADVVEAMSSHRPYRAGLGIDKALAEIERGRGSAYDPVVVDACLKLFREQGYVIPR